MSKPRAMTDKEAEEFILKFLKVRGPLTTQQIEEKAKQGSVQCPDNAVRFLIKLKAKGKIKGEVSVEKKGWIWWVE